MSKGFFLVLVVAIVMVVSGSGMMIKSISAISKTYDQKVQMIDE